MGMCSGFVLFCPRLIQKRYLRSNTWNWIQVHPTQRFSFISCSYSLIYLFYVCFLTINRVNRLDSITFWKWDMHCWRLQMTSIDWRIYLVAINKIFHKWTFILKVPFCLYHTIPLSMRVDLPVCCRGLLLKWLCFIFLFGKLHCSLIQCKYSEYEVPLLFYLPNQPLLFFPPSKKWCLTVKFGLWDFSASLIVNEPSSVYWPVTCQNIRECYCKWAELRVLDLSPVKISLTWSLA